MNSHVRRFYRTFVDKEEPVQFYHKVIALHESPDMEWEEIREKMPSFPKGWHELSRLPSTDRIEFIRDFWLTTLPFVSHVHSFLNEFFNKLDDVGIYLTQSRFDSAYECEIVYSLSDDTTFFHGTPPSEGRIEALRSAFDDVLPEDYLAFLKVHDGFSKHSDTGIIRSKNLRGVYDRLQEKIQNEAIYCGAEVITPTELIPFYESFGQPSFQCFYLSFTPLGQPGNVYYSMAEGGISDVHDRNTWNQNLVFPSFLDWLIFYLEGIED